MYQSIVSRWYWLWKSASIKVENNGAVVYVGSFLTVNNPLFFVHKHGKIVTEKNNAMFLLVSRFKMIRMLLNVVHGPIQKHITKKSNGFYNHSTLITMIKDRSKFAQKKKTRNNNKFSSELRMRWEPNKRT